MATTSAAGSPVATPTLPSLSCELSVLPRTDVLSIATNEGDCDGPSSQTLKASPPLYISPIPREEDVAVFQNKAAGLSAGSLEATASEATQEQGLSKNARKRILKEQRRLESRPKFLEKRKAERLRRRENKAKRSTLAAIAGAQDASDPAESAAGADVCSALPELAPRRHIVPASQKISSGVRILVDCNFGDCMTDKEIKSLCKQLSFCYATARRCRRGVELAFVGVDDRIRSALDHHARGHEGWTCGTMAVSPDGSACQPRPAVRSEGYLQVAAEGQRQKVCYLTADSENIISTVEPGVTYVIGGLVDHNRLKFACLKRAQQDGVSHGRLPITEHVALNSRTVLTVNNCVDILLHYVENESTGNDDDDDKNDDVIASSSPCSVASEYNDTAVSLDLKSTTSAFLTSLRWYLALKAGIPARKVVSNKNKDE